MFGIERFGINAQQFGQGLYGGFTAGRALVDVCFTGGDGFGIWAASRIGTLATLRLGQYGIDLLDDRVAFDFEADGGISQQQTKQGGKNTDGEYGGEHRG